MTGLIQRLFDRRAASIQAVPQADAAGVSASPLAALDQRLGSGLIDEAALGSGMAGQSDTDDTGPGWQISSATSVHTGDTATPPREPLSVTARDEKPGVGNTAGIARSRPAMAREYDGASPLPDRQTPEPVRRSTPPKGADDGPSVPGTPASPPQIALPPEPSINAPVSRHEQLPQTTIPPAIAPPSVTGLSAPLRPSDPQPQDPAPARPAPPHVARPAPPATLEPADAAIAPQPESDASVPVAIPVATPAANIPQPAPVPTEPAQQAAPQTRIVEQVVREVPVPDRQAPQRKGPLTADAVSKIGKLQDRRRVHTLFGRRRR